MRWTEFFIPTSKETPKDATAASHILMLRAGMIRQLAAGLYSYLPLGYRTLRKVEAIVREEMNRAGAVELHLPVLQPITIWQETGRVETMGEVLLKLRPERPGDEHDWRYHTVLGPTHEEVITEIARAYLNSYKKLPLNLYQIQTKFRGEARPKSGVLRTREFLMKDAYSFDSDKAGLDASYQKMYDAYCRIYARCGLPYLAVEADSGAIGGDVSHEFMVLTDAGEDFVAISDDGRYAANVEKASCRPASPSADDMRPIEEIHTPAAGKVEDVCRMIGTTPREMIKTLIYREVVEPDKGAANKTNAADSRSLDSQKAARLRVVVALVRGDHETNEIKLSKLSGMKLELADPKIIQELTGAAVGFAGPQGLVERADLLLIDRDVAALRNGVSGANRTDYHVRNVNPGRDFPLEGDKVRIGDVRNVVDGDPSPDTGSPIRLKKAIEVGHVFKLGTKYSQAMNAVFLNAQGKPEPLMMGCYGIGLNRIVAAAIEAGNDDGGIIWPMSIAPFEALVIALDPRDEEVMRTAGELHDQLAAEGVDVLFDDRDERAGFKFKDADLIGVPLRITVGRKSLADGKVEWSARRDGEKHPLSAAEALRRTIEAVRSAK